jgi:hypothetical protein
VKHKHTQTLGTTPLDKGSAYRKDIYLQTHNNHKRQTPMHPAGLQPATPASEWPQTYALDREFTGIAFIENISSLLSSQ